MFSRVSVCQSVCSQRVGRGPHVTTHRPVQTFQLDPLPPSLPTWAPGPSPLGPVQTCSLGGPC